MEEWNMMKHNLIDMVVVVLFVVIILDGFAGEFSSPTIFDYIKWVCTLLCAIAYIFYKRMKNRNFHNHM